MSTDVTFQVVRVKRGTENTAAEISYSALPLETRGELERVWNGAFELKHWGVLEPRLEVPETVDPEHLRAVARVMLRDIADAWEGVACELAVIIRPLTKSGPKLVERAHVVKGEARKRRERVARKLGKGVTHSRHGITLEGSHARWSTWQEADAFVRSRLTADEIREFHVGWYRYSWDNFDNTRVSCHTVFADARHLFEEEGPRSARDSEWQSVRGTLDPDLAEAVESLRSDWHGTGLELLEAAEALIA